MKLLTKKKQKRLGLKICRLSKKLLKLVEKKVQKLFLPHLMESSLTLLEKLK
nr:MAG TPA: hypothetical protein [Caudoviricetes sp.]